MSQLFIGAWNHADNYGNISDDGGVFFDINEDRSKGIISTSSPPTKTT